MQDTQAFAPLYKTSDPVNSQTGTLLTSVTVAATNASATASGVFPGGQNPSATQVQIANKTSAWAHVNFGVVASGSTVTAATVAASYPVGPGAVVVVTVAPEVNAASVILDAAPAGSTSVIFTRGGGV
jgi:hypothetical protein